MASNPLTYRENRITLKAAQTTPYFFTDTNPNTLIIRNNAPWGIWIDRHATVSPDSFSLAIPGDATRIFHRPIPLNPIWIFSWSDSLIHIESIEEDFNGSLIPQTSLLPWLPYGENFMGWVGLSQPLPYGENFMGWVGLSQPLPTGNNIIGNVRQAGWRWQRLTLAAAGTVTVTTVPGRVAQLRRDGTITVTLFDGTVQAWAAGEYTGVFPINCLTDIRVQFSAAGTAWILFQSP